MKKRVHLLFVVTMLFLFGMTFPMLACWGPDCDPCYEGDWCTWDCDSGEECCLDGYGDGECCDEDFCCDFACRECCKDYLSTDDPVHCSEDYPYCENYVCVECLTGGDCIGECHDGCVSNSCWDNNSLCTGECHNGCEDGECVEDDDLCNWCQICLDGDCDIEPGNECDENEDCDPTCEYCDNSDGGTCECECNFSITWISADSDPACICEEVTFTASIVPDNSQYYDCINWNIGGSGKTVTKSWESPGTYTVTASCANESKSIDDFVVQDVESVELSALANDDLDAGLICINAQDKYKKAKYSVTVPCGTVSVESTGTIEVGFSSIGGSDTSALEDGDEFWVTYSGSETGTYEIKITHLCSDITDTAEGIIFKFELEHEKISSNSGTAGNQHWVDESGFSMNAAKTILPAGTKNAAMVQTTYDLTVDTSPTSIGFTGKVRAKAAIDFNAHTEIEIYEWIKPVGWSLSIVKASYGIVNVEFGDVSGGYFGSSVAGLNVAIKIADSATWKYGDHQRDIGDVDDPWWLEPRIETFDEYIPIHRADDPRIYDPGTPIEFWIMGEVCSNSDLWKLDIFGDPDGYSSYIGENELTIEDIEVSEDDGEYEIVSGN